MEQCILELIGLPSHYYEGIHKSALKSLLKVIRVFYNLTDSESWTPGINNAAALDSHAQELTNLVLLALLEMYETEDNKYVYLPF